MTKDNGRPSSFFIGNGSVASCSGLYIAIMGANHINLITPGGKKSHLLTQERDDFKSLPSYGKCLKWHTIINEPMGITDNES